MSKRALVVDHDFFFLEFLSELLEKRGYEVVKAHDGKEGVIRLNEGPIDLVFMEIILPKIDGRQLIRYARRKCHEQGIPIIAVSGYLVEQMEALHQIGADYYIAKGAMEKMGDHIEAFFDELENESVHASDDLHVLMEPGQVYPRQSTAHLLDIISYHEAAIECAGTGILVVDADGKILRANPLALEILKESMEGILNTSLTALFSAENKDRIVEALKGVIRDGKAKKLDLPLQTDSDRVRATVSVLHINGKRMGWIVLLDDMAAE